MLTLPTFLRAGFWIGLVLLTAASLVPVAVLPSQVLDIWDKAQHALGFAGMATLGFAAYPRHVRHIAVGLLLWGGAIELMQAASGWRHGDGIDWLADAIGIAVAAMAWRAWHQRRAARA